MRFVKLLLLIGIASPGAACASYRVSTPAEGCSVLAAPVLARVTPHAPLGASGDSLLDWQLYGAAETGQLNIANRDKADGLSIIQKCEERDARAQAKINAPFWAFWR